MNSSRLVRRTRLISGLILFVFVLGHLINLSLGLWSVEAMDAARWWILLPWSNTVGLLLLIICMVAHMVLGLAALYRRSTLYLNSFDALQLIIGLLIPVMLLPHFIEMTVNPLMTSKHADYAHTLMYYWVEMPSLGLRQVLAVILVWVHGCMGLYLWLRLLPLWQRWSSIINILMVAIPVVALLGFAQAGKSVIAQAVTEAETKSSSSYSSSYAGNTDSDYASDYGSDSDSDYGSDYSSASGTKPDASATSSSGDDYASDYATSEPESDAANTEAGAPSARQLVHTIAFALPWAYLGLVVLILLARRIRVGRLRTVASIDYGDGTIVDTHAGLSVLEVSRANGVMHASLCSGKGRCGACQIRVLDGENNLSAPAELERHTLSSLGVGGSRLACQARLTGGRVQIERCFGLVTEATDVVAHSANSHTTVESA